MKQHRGRDRRATYAFLIKHGLTEKEAREYTALTTEFNLHRLSADQRQFLEQNFDAQVYAFRKMREKLLLADAPQADFLYKKDASTVKKGDRSNPMASMDQNELREMLKRMSSGKAGPSIERSGQQFTLSK